MSCRENVGFPNECPKCGKPTNGKPICLACSKLPEDGKRHRIRKGGKDYYLFVSARSIMFSGPGESSVAEQEFFQLINLVCRLSSKMRSNGVGWKHVC